MNHSKDNVKQALGLEVPPRTHAVRAYTPEEIEKLLAEHSDV